MKQKLIITALLLILTLGAKAQIKVEVSEPVELMSILSRTAGFQEYHRDLAGQYTKDTETWFAPYKEHSIISYFQGLRNHHDISYDAVMSMAIHLDINNGKIKFLGEKSDRLTSKAVDSTIVAKGKFSFKGQADMERLPPPLCRD